MEVLLLTLFLSLLFALLFLLLFVRERRVHAFGSVEQEALMPLDDGEPLAPKGKETAPVDVPEAGSKTLKSGCRCGDCGAGCKGRKHGHEPGGHSEDDNHQHPPSSSSLPAS